MRSRKRTIRRPRFRGTRRGERNWWEWIYAAVKASIIAPYTLLVFLSHQILDSLPKYLFIAPVTFIVILGAIAMVIAMSHECWVQKWTNNEDQWDE